MKRYGVFTLCMGLALLCLAGCGANGGTVHEHARFSLTLPEAWDRIDTEGSVSFAPLGEPVGGASIVFYVTEKNYYFSSFTQEDYAGNVKEFTGYDTLSDVTFSEARVNGWDAHRVAFAAKLNGKAASIVLYAIDAHQTCFFILLDAGADSYADMFDDAIKSVKLYKP